MLPRRSRGVPKVVGGGADCRVCGCPDEGVHERLLLAVARPGGAARDFHPQRALALAVRSGNRPPACYSAVCCFSTSTVRRSMRARTSGATANAAATRRSQTVASAVATPPVTVSPQANAVTAVPA
jgi:hypothetical protein